MTRARDLARIANSNALTVDSSGNVGIGSTVPTSKLSVVGIVSATSFSGNVTGTATGLSGSPNITVGNIVGTAATNFNPFTVNINTQRGKQSGYATLNPISSFGSPTISNGNLTFAASGASYQNAPATLFFTTTDKYYWEVTLTKLQSGADNQQFAIGDIPASGSAGFTNSFLMYAYYADATYRYGTSGASPTSLSVTSTTGDVLEFAYDGVSGKVWFGVNGIWFLGGNPATNSNPIYTFASIISRTFSVIHYGTTGISAVNFGQKPFKFPPPAGFQPLALANTPRPTIVRPDQFVGIVTYYAADGVAGIATGLSFKPDLVWVKSRTSARSNVIVDSVRGTNSVLWTNLTDAQLSSSQYVSQFNSNGFNYGAAGDVTNNSSLVGWCWKAGGNSNTYNINDVGYATASAAGLTAGSITPTGASVNTKSGFSIITYTGPNDTSAHSFSHGLGKKPSFILIKNRDRAFNWDIYHSSLGYNSSLIFTSATTRSGAYSAEPDSTLVNVQWNYTTYQNDKYVAYCWTEIPGFSKFGSYVGNLSTDGPVVNCNFRPRIVLIKRSTSDSSGGNWILRDAERSKFNPTQINLFPNLAIAETTEYDVDFLSNGFKIRSNNVDINNNGGTFIFAAFAETPTQNLYGAQANAR